MANNARVEELRKMSTEDLDQLARKIDVQPHKSKIETARRIERREFFDRRAANKLPHIKDIF